MTSLDIYANADFAPMSKDGVDETAKRRDNVSTSGSNIYVDSNNSYSAVRKGASKSAIAAPSKTPNGCCAAQSPHVEDASSDSGTSTGNSSIMTDGGDGTLSASTDPEYEPIACVLCQVQPNGDALSPATNDVWNSGTSLGPAESDSSTPNESDATTSGQPVTIYDEYEELPVDGGWSHGKDQTSSGGVSVDEQNAGTKTAEQKQSPSKFGSLKLSRVLKFKSAKEAVSPKTSVEKDCSVRREDVDRGADVVPDGDDVTSGSTVEHVSPASSVVSGVDVVIRSADRSGIANTGTIGDQSDDSRPTFIAMYAFRREEGNYGNEDFVEGIMDVEPHDVVYHLGQSQGDWIYCQNRDTGETGWIPRSYLREAISAVSLGSRVSIGADQPEASASPVAGGCDQDFDEDFDEEEALQVNEYYIAIHPYQATHDGDLSLSVGDAILVLEMLDNGWWRGTVDGCSSGYFPESYVQLMPSYMSPAQTVNCNTSSEPSKSCTLPNDASAPDVSNKKKPKKSRVKNFFATLPKRLTSRKDVAASTVPTDWGYEDRQSSTSGLSSAEQQTLANEDDATSRPSSGIQENSERIEECETTSATPEVRNETAKSPTTDRTQPLSPTSAALQTGVDSKHKPAAAKGRKEPTVLGKIMFAPFMSAAATRSTKSPSVGVKKSASLSRATDKQRQASGSEKTTPLSPVWKTQITHVTSVPAACVALNSADGSVSPPTTTGMSPNTQRSADVTGVSIQPPSTACSPERWTEVPDASRSPSTVSEATTEVRSPFLRTESESKPPPPPKPEALRALRIGPWKSSACVSVDESGSSSRTTRKASKSRTPRRERPTIKPPPPPIRTVSLNDSSSPSTPVSPATESHPASPVGHREKPKILSPKPKVVLAGSGKVPTAQKPAGNDAEPRSADSGPSRIRVKDMVAAVERYGLGRTDV